MFSLTAVLHFNILVPTVFAFQGKILLFSTSDVSCIFLWKLFFCSRIESVPLILTKATVSSTKMLRYHLMLSLKFSHKNPCQDCSQWWHHGNSTSLLVNNIIICKSSGVVVQWLSLLHSFIQLSLNSGSAQVQTLLAAYGDSRW